MSDKLKEEIDRRRASFELHEFDLDAGWKDLSASLKRPETKPERSWMFYVSRGLAACLLVFTGWYFISGSRSGDPLPADSMAYEWMEAQHYYEQVIDTKFEVVKAKVDDPELINDIEALDEAFADLKKDLKDDLHNEEVIEAMMTNYRLKLEILERILEELDEDEAKNSDQHISM